MSPHKIASNTRANDLRIGIVLSRFNAKVGEPLLDGALRALADAGAEESSITVVTAPGALEAGSRCNAWPRRDYDALSPWRGRPRRNIPPTSSHRIRVRLAAFSSSSASYRQRNPDHRHRGTALARAGVGSRGAMAAVKWPISWMPSMRTSRWRARVCAAGVYRCCSEARSTLIRRTLPGPGFACDTQFIDGLWRGITGEFDMLAGAFAPFLDRAATELSPVEKSILTIGAWELLREPEVPYRVAINEAVELAKSYGGTDGHKYVNGVLDKLAASARAPEILGARTAS
jgi:N utilization substance protein B